MSSAKRWAVMHGLRGRQELTLDEALAQLSPCDLVLVEGFKRAPIPKIEICRSELGKPQLFPDDPYIIAVASVVVLDTLLPQLDLNDSGAIAAFIIEKYAQFHEVGVR